jgi:hypothetical protein
MRLFLSIVVVSFLFLFNNNNIKIYAKDIEPSKNDADSDSDLNLIVKINKLKLQRQQPQLQHVLVEKLRNNRITPPTSTNKQQQLPTNTRNTIKNDNQLDTIQKRLLLVFLKKLQAQIDKKSFKPIMFNSKDVLTNVGRADAGDFFVYLVEALRQIFWTFFSYERLYEIFINY